jgi:hypothetical protein
MRTASCSAVVVILAFAIGALTAYAQGWLPEQLGSLANSSGSWALVACALSLMATTSWLAAAYGVASLLALLAGYVLGAEVQGFASSTGLVVFWGIAALLAGPLLGVSAHWVRTNRGSKAAVGGGAVSGVLIGEGCYALGAIADTTYPPYWWGQVLVGLALLLLVAWRRLTGLPAVALSVAVAVFVAGAFVVVYGRNLIALVTFRTMSLPGLLGLSW